MLFNFLALSFPYRGFLPRYEERTQMSQTVTILSGERQVDLNVLGILTGMIPVFQVGKGCIQRINKQG